MQEQEQDPAPPLRDRAPAHAKLEALAAEGEHVADGRFTLDPAQARAKLREYQLEDPTAYILLLVEAAWLAGFSGLRSELRVQHGTTTTAEFPGLELDARALSGLLAAVFASTSELEGEAQQQARATQMLGLAANAALGLDAVELRVEHEPASGERLSVRFDRDGQPSLERGPREQRGARPLTRLVVVGRPLDLRRGPREAQLLRERAAFAGFPVLSDGKRISRGLHSALEGSVGTRGAVSLREPRRVIGAACYLEQSGAPAELQVITRGVLSERIPLVGYPADFRAVIEADLRKDLSQRQVLRDAKFRAVHEAVEEAHAALPNPHAQLQLQPQSQPDPDADAGASELRWPGFLILAIWLLMLIGGVSSLFDAPLRALSPGAPGIEAGARWEGELMCDEEDFEIRLEVSAATPERGVLHLADGQQGVYLRGSHFDDTAVYIDANEWKVAPSEAFEALDFDLTVSEDGSLLGGFARKHSSLVPGSGRDDCFYLSLMR